MIRLLLVFAALAAFAESDVVRLTSDGHLKQRPCWSPDGKQVVFARHQGATIFLFLRDLKTGQEERLTSHTASQDRDLSHRRSWARLNQVAGFPKG